MAERDKTRQGNESSLWERFTDWLAKSVGAAVTDIRHKFEEAVWGRIVTPQSLAERSGWEVPGERTERASDPGRSKDRPSSPEREGGSVLDMFYDRLSPSERAEHFREWPEQDRGIER